MSQFTIVLHGNDATGKTTLCRAIKNAGYTCYTRGDDDPAHDVALKTFDGFTLKLPDDDRESLPTSYTAPDGTQRRIVRFILDADIPVLQSRIASRPQKDKWESEKALFYFRARFTELAAYFGIPIICTGTKSVAETVQEIISYVQQPKLLELFEAISLKQLTLERIEELTMSKAHHQGVDYEKRLQEIIVAECGGDSIFTREDIESQCKVDPELRYAIVNAYDRPASQKPYSLRLVTEGESKQIYKLQTTLTDYFKDKVFIVLKPTIYSHSQRSTAEIENLSGIRATGSRLFLEMLHRAGVVHKYEGLNRHGVVLAQMADVNPIEICYKAYCEGTDKHSFFGMRDDRDITLSTGEYRGGPYVRFDWRNPNHIYKGADPSVHPLYFLMEVSVGKQLFYQKFLTARAIPFGDKCLSEELVHGVQEVEQSIDFTIRVFFTIQHYLSQVGLEVLDGCIMVDRDGKAMWSEINQDCMRIKRPSSATATREPFDKDVWRVGGSSAKDAIVAKWTQLNDILNEYLTKHPFHSNEMESTGEPYGAVAKLVLNDKRFRITPRYKALYERLASLTRV